MADTKNFYPELPAIPYQHTSIDMATVTTYANSLVGKYSVYTVRMAYAIIRNESGNMQYGVNNNYAGIQADVGRWTDLPVQPIATCVKTDNAGDTRRFLCFNAADGYKGSFELLCIKIQARSIVSVQDYFNKWVSNPKEDTAEARKDFESLLNSAASRIFAANIA